MKRGFYNILAAQFLSSLADNALLIAAIALLASIQAPDWMTPLLKLFFVLSYVGLAAWVGIFADLMPKGRVMFITNAVKVFGCLLMLFGSHPLLSYAVVGIGAAAYSPAKYGILTELLPPEKLVIANGWIEGLTVVSIILGVVLGGVLIKPEVAGYILQTFHLPAIGLDTDPEAALFIVGIVYALAAAVNLTIPDTGVRYARPNFEPIASIKNFFQSCSLLWHDKTRADLTFGHHALLGRRRRASVSRFEVGRTSTRHASFRRRHSSGCGVDRHRSRCRRCSSLHSA